MNKERAAQLAEKNELKEKDKVCLSFEFYLIIVCQLYEEVMASMMKKEYEKAMELEIQKEKEKYEQSVQYQQQLHHQLNEQV